ncbi:MAG TPA: lysophospholipid acyltransferase family protein [Thermoanaerobaculia bacterium]|nr:lysophospholipid acyltransferase family protein [Thermoanaerobaculia bacterium]
MASSRSDPFRYRLLRRALLGLSAILGHLSWRGTQRLGRGIGRIGWHLARRDRRRTLEHLRIAFPELSERDRRALGRASFRHHGQTLTECLHLMSKSCEDIGRVVQVEGWEHVEEARRVGRPILVFTGHCGNWELIGAAANCRGLGLRPVAREVEDTGLQRLLLSFRERFGTYGIARGGKAAARELLASVRGGGALAMLIDQDTKVEGVWVPFFGRPAFTPVGAARLAAKLGAAALPTFIERRPDGTHRVTFHAPLDLPEDATEATARMTATIEAQIRRHPEQWVWMHRRWRRQPAGTDTIAG